MRPFDSPQPGAHECAPYIYRPPVGGALMRPWVNSRIKRDDARSIFRGPGRINAPPTFIPRPVGGALMRPWVRTQ